MSYESYYRQDIDNFQRYGAYTYKFDEVGNVVFDSSSGDFSQVYLGLPLQVYLYDNAKIVGFYDPNFTEFVSQETPSFTEDDIQQMQFELESQKAQTEELTRQLEALIEANESNLSEAERSATKRVILELRKALGEGRVDSDFSSDFPYTPLVKPTSISDEQTPEKVDSGTTQTTSTLTTPDPALFEARASASAALQASASAAALKTTLKTTLDAWVDERAVQHRNNPFKRKPLKLL